MTYLRIRNFWKYQNADAWKKAQVNKGGHKNPAWCKLYVTRDLELDAEKPITRLVFYELLRLATVHSNAISNDSKAIASAISLPTQAVSQAIHRLLEGGWLSETKTGRASRERSRERSRKSRQQIEIEIEKELTHENGGEHSRKSATQRASTKPRAKRSCFRPTDPLWEALVAELGEPATKSERGRFNAALKELREIQATPDDVRRRCRAYRRQWPNVTLTPQALVSNWTRFAPPPAPTTSVEEDLDLPELDAAARAQNLERIHALTQGLTKEVVP